MIFLERTREGRRQTNIGTVSNLTSGKPERWDGAHMGFSELIHTILN